MAKKQKERAVSSHRKNYIDKIKMVSFYVFLALFIVGTLLFLTNSFSRNTERRAGVKHESKMSLPEGFISVEIADTQEEVEQGLSGRSSIGADEGMLFVFPQMGQYAFWMKDMKFALDLIWISDEGRIVDIKENVAPNTYPKKTFKNDAFAKYVLEMKAGSASKYGLFLGTSVGLPSGIAK